MLFFFLETVTVIWLVQSHFREGHLLVSFSKYSVKSLPVRICMWPQFLLTTANLLCLTKVIRYEQRVQMLTSFSINTCDPKLSVFFQTHFPFIVVNTIVKKTQVSYLTFNACADLLLTYNINPFNWFEWSIVSLNVFIWWTNTDIKYLKYTGVSTKDWSARKCHFFAWQCNSWYDNH